MKVVHFDRLPRSSREALTDAIREQRHLAAAVKPGPGRVWPSALAVIGALLIVVPIVGSWGVELAPVPVIALDVVAAFLLGWGLLGARRARLTSRALPFPQGTYVFERDVVVTGGALLTITPTATLTDLTRRSIAALGPAANVVLHFTHPTGSVALSVRPAVADRALAAINGWRRGDGEAPPPDPFAAARADRYLWEELDATPPPRRPADPVAGPAPGLFARQAVVAGAIFGAVAGPGIWFGANAVSDAAVLRNAIGHQSVSMLARYLDRGGREADAVRAVHLPQAAFEEARASGDVTSLRGFRAAYPGSAHDAAAKAAIHERYQAALAELRGRAAANRALADHLGPLLAWVEEHDDPRLQLTFEAPDTSTLEVVDQLVASSDEGRNVVPVAPAFDRRRLATLEKRLARQLATAFASAVPSDILRLEAVTGSGDRPRLEVAYSVHPSRDFYSDSAEREVYVGLAVAFEVALSVPGQGEPYEFAFNVEPPNQFTAGQLARGATIYGVMIDRAFDQLGTTMSAGFFAGITTPPAREEEDATDDEATAQPADDL